MSDTLDQGNVVDELAAMRAELAELRARLDAKEAAPAPAAPAEKAELLDLAQATTDRRSLLRKGGIAAAAAATGAVVLSQASPAAAADGGSVIIGQTNTGTSTTQLRAAGATPGGTLFVQDGGSSPVISLFPSVINGWADGTNASILHGIYGYSTKTDGYGVVGIGDAGGVFASGSQSDITFGGLGNNPQGTLNQRGSMVFAGPAAGGDLWFAVGANGADWRKVAGPATAGQLHVLPVPVRVFDSRAGFPPANSAKGQFVNQTKVIDAKNNGSGVPTSCQAVLVNFAVTNTNSGGFGTLYKNGASDPGTSNINWSMASMTVSNMAITAVDASSLFNCKIAGSADVIIDVIGYYQ